MILPQLKNLNINTNLSGAVDIVLPFKIIGQMVPIISITTQNWHVMHIICKMEITHFGGCPLKIGSLLYLYNLPKYSIKQFFTVLFGSLSLSFIFFI